MLSVDGAFHDVDSSVLAFELAARTAARQGLRQCRSRLKEPIMKVVVHTPDASLGDVIGDLNARRGQIQELTAPAQSTAASDVRTVIALVPLANMFNYVSVLRSISKGRASYSMLLEKYEFVPATVETELVAKFNPGTTTAAVAAAGAA